VYLALGIDIAEVYGQTETRLATLMPADRINSARSEAVPWGEVKISHRGES